MLDKLLFRLRSAMLDLWPLLGSWKLSVVLMVGTAAFYLLLTVYAFRTPAHVVQNIAGLVVFWVLYGLLLLNTVTCLVNRLPRLRREIGRNPMFGQTQPDRVIDLPSDASRDDVIEQASELGFSTSELDEGVVFGVRRRWTALGTYLFHGAFFLLALGFLLSIASRHESKVWVAVGEDFTGAELQYLSRSTPKPLAMGVDVPHFRVQEIRPKFWKDQLLFTTLEADLEIQPDEVEKTTKINRPLMFGLSRFLRLSGFGYTPRFEIRAPTGEVIESSFVKLNVFPPGQRDFFTPSRLPYRIYVEIYPNAEIAGKEVVNQGLDLARPVIVTTVYRGRFAIATAALRPGETVTVEGVELSYPEIRYWGEFIQVHDLGIGWIFASFLVGIAGLMLKLPGRREEISWRPGEGGRGGELLVWSAESEGAE